MKEVRGSKGPILVVVVEGKLMSGGVRLEEGSYPWPIRGLGRDAKAGGVERGGRHRVEEAEGGRKSRRAREARRP